MFDDFEDDLIDEEDLLDGGASLVETGLRAPRKSDFCVGFDKAEQDLLHQIEKGTMPHALIFAGPEGIGKSTFTYRMIRYLLKNGGKETADGGMFGDDLPAESVTTFEIPSDDPVFSKVASGGHPDLMTVERAYDEKKQRYKGNVDVDSVRKITPFMRMTASQGGWRIVLVDDADTMNRNAQNAVLKILEEPPAHALIILIAHRAGAMIPTIRSRARLINFAPLSKADFTTVLRREHAALPMDDIDVLHNISGGSAGRALQIVDEGGLEAIDKIMGLLYGWPKWQWSQIHLLADAMSRPGQEDSLRAFQEVFIWIMNSMLRAKARNEIPAAPLNNDAVRQLMDHYSLNQLIEITGNLQAHFDKVQAANLDKRHAVIGAFSLFDIKKAA